MNRKLAVGLGVGVLVAGGVGGVAYASIPDSTDGLYHACVKDAADSNGNGHMVRMLDKATESCASGWTEDTWPSRGFSTYQKQVERNTTDGPQEETLNCNAGDLAVSGGWRFFNQTFPGELQMYDSHPTGGSGWLFGVQTNDSTHVGRYYLFVNCAVGS